MSFVSVRHEAYFRRETRHGSCVGVMFVTFRCAACGETKGRRGAKVVDGRRVCSQCAKGRG